MGTDGGGAARRVDGGGDGVTGTCAAPYTSLRFEPDGRVSVCCVNGQYLLGLIPHDTIRSIWEGQRVADLRAAIDAGDFSLGCHDCRPAHLAGRRLDTEAREFDRLVTDDLGRWPRRLEFALSNTCNLQCVHCNGELSSAIRSQREHRPPLESPYGDDFFAELEEFLPHATELAFLGGEPFLSRSARRVWDLVRDAGLDPEVHVTTNGTILDERSERYVSDLRMHVAVSVDGLTPDTFESVRVGAVHSEVMANVARLRELTASTGSALAVNICAMVQNWRELPDLLAWCEEHADFTRLITVTYPMGASLLHLPADDLRRVVAALEARDDEVRRRLTRSVGEWDRLLRQLQAAAGRSGAVPVSLGTAPRPSPADAVERFRRRVAQEESADGRAAVIVDAVDDVIRTVSGTEWARSLRIDELQGQSLLRLVPLLGLRLGFTPAVSTEDVGGGMLRNVIEAVAPAWTMTIVIHLVQWEEGGRRRQRLAITVPGGLPDALTSTQEGATAG